MGGYIMGVAPFFVSSPLGFELVLIASGPWGVCVDHIVLYIPRGILPRGSNRPYYIKKIQPCPPFTLIFPRGNRFHTKKTYASPGKKREKKWYSEVYRNQTHHIRRLITWLGTSNTITLLCAENISSRKMDIEPAWCLSGYYCRHKLLVQWLQYID